MQHNTQQKDGQESVCASLRADTYFLETKYWTLHTQLNALLDILPLEHKEIKELAYWHVKQVYSKTSLFTFINILLKDLLRVTLILHKVTVVVFFFFFEFPDVLCV